MRTETTSALASPTLARRVSRLASALAVCGSMPSPSAALSFVRSIGSTPEIAAQPSTSTTSLPTRARAAAGSSERKSIAVTRLPASADQVGGEEALDALVGDALALGCHEI